MSSVFGNRTCKVCGNVFYPKCHNQLCCCLACSAENEKLNKSKSRSVNFDVKKVKKTKSSKKNKTLSIGEISALAREAGMSYGEYIARTEMGMKG